MRYQSIKNGGHFDGCEKIRLGLCRSGVCQVTVTRSFLTFHWFLILTLAAQAGVLAVSGTGLPAGRRVLQRFIFDTAPLTNHHLSYCTPSL